jgi:hypothetical protein
VGRCYHISSVRNRESISRHGLDVSRMGVAMGIAGSPMPEQQGSFLCFDEFTVEFFIGLNNTGTAVDVWAVDGVDTSVLLEVNGCSYYPGHIPPSQLQLVRQDVPPLGG